MKIALKKDGYYFPHICNSRNDRKIRKARLQLGLEAYAIYFMTLEVLREQKDYKYPISDLDVLADEIGTSLQKVEVMIYNYGLFEFDDEKMFFSSAMIRLMEPWENMKKVNSLKGKASAESRKKKAEEHLRLLSQQDSSQQWLNTCSSDVQQVNKAHLKNQQKKNNSTTTNKINDISEFIGILRKKYVNKEILKDHSQIVVDLDFKADVVLRITDELIGKLYDKRTQETFTAYDGKRIWDWLYANQDQIIGWEYVKNAMD